ncbi:MAG: response regulator [Spirochaetia bacterium]|nr:response regulator [Spirochaetia bacterium]
MKLKHKISTILVEDEPWARDLMSGYINEIPELKLNAAIGDGYKALKIIQSEKFDLLFLDINLPNLSGIEVLKKIKIKPYTIFTTVSKENALDAFELGAIDYLVKPIEKKRFNKAVERAMIFLRSNKKDKEPEYSKQKEENQFSESLFINLQREYGLTYQEASICVKIFEGLTREELTSHFNIMPATLKHHLKYIFSKTIDIENKNCYKKQGKLQMLTTFLFKMREN